tara:strand:- start:172 stop:348 length:177 start_codon:yes stop_codon:yes gene_type:complete
LIPARLARPPSWLWDPDEPVVYLEEEGTTIDVDLKTLGDNKATDTEIIKDRLRNTIKK